MATYKLIQDIEAEDHILGPLTLRQFIFALIAAFFGYLCFIVATRGVAFLLILFAPPALFFAFFALPFGKDQPTEIWFLAKLRFWLLPRKRMWDQSGVKELVTITVPKKVEQVLTDGLSQTEVKSRLQALANTIDSRGWAVKNVNVYTPQVVVGGSDSDRLLDLSSFPQEVPADATPASDDILDNSSPVAQQMDAMVSQSVQAHHQKLMEELNRPEPTAAAAPAGHWFMSPSAAQDPAMPAALPLMPAAPLSVPAPLPNPVPNFVPAPLVPLPSMPSYSYTPPPVAPDVPAGSLANEDQLTKELKSHATKGAAYGHMRTLRPLSDQPVASPAPAVSAAPVPVPTDPDILALAGNNDLNVETLARQVHKTHKDKGSADPNEVVISLH
ncbi:MAG TPA: PrgI family protein [Candidatus Saccharimonadales bacterium]|jgi:hypothetical protein|nr:PrgI family protein [Candidatus Saccharimonadales bacterium]